MLLSDRKIQLLKPDLVERRLADGEGLYLRIVPQGTKSFQFRFSYFGRRQTLTLGTYPDLSLALAREKAQDCREILAKGKNPATEAQQERQRMMKALTVEELVADYYERHLKHKLKRPEAMRDLILADVGTLGNVLVPDVQPAHITAAVERMIKRGALVGANRFLSGLKGMFKFAVDKHMIMQTPVTMTRAAAGGRESSRKVTLRFDQICHTYMALFMPRKVKGRAISWQVRCALRMILLTAQRPIEVVSMRWAEVDLDQGLWVIPAEKTKSPENGAHTVHLNKLAMDLLKAVKALPEASTEWVFPANRKGQRKGDADPTPHLARHSLSQAVITLREQKVINCEFTPHDLRRTVATRMGDLEPAVEPHVIEKVLNHQMAGVMAIYNRNDYFPLRQDAMNRWGSRLEKELSPYLTSSYNQRTPDSLRHHFFMSCPTPNSPPKSSVAGS